MKRQSRSGAFGLGETNRFGRILSIAIVFLVLPVLVVWPEAGHAQIDLCKQQLPKRSEPAAQLRTPRDFINDFQESVGISSGKTKTWVQAGGSTMDIVFDLDLHLQGSVRPWVCASIEWKPEPREGQSFDHCDVEPTTEFLRVLSLTRSTDPVTKNPQAVVRLSIDREPDFAWRKLSTYLWCDANIYVVIYDVSKENWEIPLAGFGRLEWISQQWQGWAVAVIWLFVAFFGAVGASKAIRGRSNESPDGNQEKEPPDRDEDKESRDRVQKGWRAIFDPVIITSAGDGRVSLSVLQVFFFTLLVGAMLAFMVGRLGGLSELSPSVLLLLGISAGGAGLAKATDNSRRGRLTYAHWVWIKKKGWKMKAGEPGWGQLMTTNKNFDVSKFQVLAFSLLVAIALLAQGSQGLAGFEIPETMLGLLGLSQAAYIGGKFVTPPTISDYDNKIGELIKAEKAYASKILEGEEAKEEYNSYYALAEQAALMHEMVFNSKIDKQHLEPRTPKGAAGETEQQPNNRQDPEQGA